MDVLAIVSFTFNCLLGLAAFLARSNLAEKERRLILLETKMNAVEISQASHKMFCETELKNINTLFSKIDNAIDRIRAKLEE